MKHNHMKLFLSPEFFFSQGQWGDHGLSAPLDPPLAAPTGGKLIATSFSGIENVLFIEFNLSLEFC